MINDRVTRASKQFYVTHVPPVHVGDAQGKMSDSEVAQNSGLNTSLLGKGVWASQGSQWFSKDGWVPGRTYGRYDGW